MHKGDIILIPFPFTDLSGNKLRPAVIIAELRYDIIVCFITTQLHQQEKTDLLILPKSTNGIKKESLIRASKIATLDKSISIGIIGELDSTEINQLNRMLIEVLQLK